METFKKGYTRVYQIIDLIIYYIILGITILALISIGGSMAKGQEPTIFGYKPIYVLTGSMEPSVPTKSIMISKRIEDYNEIQPGVVITYVNGDYDKNTNIVENKTITHRVVSVDAENQTFQTKGDANNNIDTFHTPEGSTSDIRFENSQYTTKKVLTWFPSVVFFVNRMVENPPFGIAVLVALISFIYLIKIGHRSIYEPKYEIKLFGNNNEEVSEELPSNDDAEANNSEIKNE